ncbi:MAG: ABC transporter ATP-binding protein [Kastovskya adunca ATA6-11-RM4]|jgi:lipopolysaccharide transport system ATP-binding protein|nr:ABC transporter ATP-binding protein [Kastovskya adunca ATA6-11-RM4]
MSDTVIRVENLGKKYIINRKNQERYTALRDVIADRAKLFGRRIKKPFAQQNKHQTFEDFWALKDVSFEVKQGDRVGIIGRNGAGKSTLLKILSRITEPTTGRISIKGRVASLLEVGTGFHPELTGRENIYLNGAILGMSRVEIKKKFDEIVSFAEVEKFLDTPVKRYSSGMYVRLAFAVAAHLEPEILVVDEVLAVGDAAFQQKCLGKMEEVGKEGRTVLFVSHNIGAIRALCKSGILLSEGTLVANDLIDNVITNYISSPVSCSDTYIAEKNLEKPHFRKIEISQGERISGNAFAIDQPIRIKFHVERLEKKEIIIGIVIRNSQGLWIHHSSDEFNSETVNNSSSRRECRLPPYALSPGKYYVDAYLGQRNIETLENIIDCLIFEVEFTGIMSDRTTAGDWKGICGPGLLSWH